MTLRGGRKRLGFGVSPEDIEEASKEIEEMEAEIFEELYGVSINYGEVMETLEKQIVCPVCQRDRIEENGPSMVKCRSKVILLTFTDHDDYFQSNNYQDCGLLLIMVGGVVNLQSQLDSILDHHNSSCDQQLQFGKGDNCMICLCPACDYCHYLGGF